MSCVRTLAAGLLLAAAPAAATVFETGGTDAPHGITADADGVLRVATQLADTGRLAAALALLDGLAPTDAARFDMRFARAILLIDLGRAGEAEPVLARLTIERPNLVRVRLEHGRALAGMGRFATAERELRRALADNPPKAVVASVDVALRGIRAQRRFFGGFGIGFAPDTNINSATAADTVNLFGLPFALDPSARRQSGIGAVVNADLGWRQPLSPVVAGVVRLNGWARLYPGADRNVDDIAAEVRGGVEIALPKGRLTPELTYLRRWFGGRGYAHGLGGGLRVDLRLGQTLFGTALLDVRRLDYDRTRALDGWTYSVRGQADRQLGADTTVSVGLTATRTDARDTGYASWLGEGDVTLYRDWKHGWTSGLTLGSGRLVGDTAIDAFGARRHDWRWRASASLANRRLSIWNMMPTVRLGIDRIDSTVALYDLRRTRVELLLTRTF